MFHFLTLKSIIQIWQRWKGWKVNALYLQLDGPFIVINGAEKRSVMAGLLADNFCVQYLNFQFILAFSHTEGFKLTCFLGVFHLQFAINLLQCALFHYRYACMSRLSAMCPGWYTLLVTYLSSSQKQNLKI